MAEEAPVERPGPEPSYVGVAMGAVLNVLAHAVLLFGFVFVLVYVVPQFKEMLADMQMEAPALTIALIELSDGCKHYWYVLVLGFLAFLGLDAVLFSFLAARRRTWILAVLWSVAVTSFLAVGEAVFVIAGLHVPLVNLMTSVGQGS